MSNSELRDRVLELEPYPEDLKDSIREKIIHTRERPLKAWERPLLTFFSVAAGMMLLGTASWGIIQFDMISQSPKYMLAGFAVSVLLLCWVLVWLLTSLKKGTMRQRNESFIVYGAAGFMLYMVVAAILSDGGVQGDGLAGLIIVGVCVISTHINAAELRLRERVLRNELALVELSELVAARTAVDLKDS